METNSFETSKIYHFIDEVDYSPNGIVSKIIMKKDAGNITLFSFDKGQSLSEHSAPFDAFIHILEGKAEILINKKPYLLSKDDYIIMPANIPHAVNAIEKFKMMLIMVKSI